MHDPEFREEYQRLRTQAAEMARSELEGLMLKSAGVLAHALEDKDPKVRLQAARATMVMGLRHVDMRELFDRIDTVEEAQEFWIKRKPLFPY